MIDTILFEAGPGETRAALLSNGRLWQLEHERAFEPARRGSLHRGRVRAIDRGLNAAFVDLGEGPDGFLRARDVVTAAGRRSRRQRIERVLQEGAPVLVQLSTEARGDKGPLLTMAACLAGRFADYWPARPEIRFDSGRGDPELASTLQSALTDGEGLDIDDREALGAARDHILAEVAALRARWEAARARAAALSAPGIVDPGPDLVTRVLMAHAGSLLRRIIADDEATASAARRWIERYGGTRSPEVTIDRPPQGSFAAHDVSAAIDEALGRSVPIPGGGRLVFDGGAALTMIDVDSADRDGRAGHLAHDMNIAAVPEIARQLRLRNVGGAIVIDAMKAPEEEDRQALLAALSAALATDPARPQVLGFTRLGLVELARPRQGPSLSELLLEPLEPAQSRPDAVAYDALRALVREARARPRGQFVLRSSEGVCDILAGRLAPAVQAAQEAAGATLSISPQPGWPRTRIEIAEGDR